MLGLRNSKPWHRPDKQAKTAAEKLQNRPHGLYYGWVIVFSALVIMAVTVGTMHSFGIFFKPLLREFGWTRATTAGVFSLGNVIQGVAAILVGLVSNRYGPRRLMLLAGALVGLSYALGSWTTALWQFYIYFGVLQGIGRGIPYNPLMATLARWFTQRRGLALGIALSGGGVGTILFPVLANLLIERFDWQTAFLIFGLLSGALVVASGLLLRARPLHPSVSLQKSTASDGTALSQPGIRGEEGTPLSQVLFSRAFWLIIIAGFLSNLSITVVFVHLVAYATDKGIPAAVAASFVSVIGAFNIVGKVAMGAFSDRYGLKLGILICFGVGAFTMFWLNFSSTVWMFYLFAMLFGLAYAGWIPLFPILVGHIFGVGSMAAVLGFLSAANTIGGAVGAYVAGYIFDVTHSYQWAFVMAGSALILAIPCQLLVNRLRQDAPLAKARGTQ